MSNLFTATELSTLHNTEFFVIKAAATKKIEHLFAAIHDEIKEVIQKENITFPKEVDSTNGKIFRGENYLGFPYLVLDYPKHFSKESVLAFRTMFWWGNFFSFTVHLQGKALEEQRSGLIKKIPSLKNQSIYICVDEKPWQYHYNTDNYQLIDKLSNTEIEKIFRGKEFVKLSRHIPLNDHEKLSAFCKESFILLK